MDLSLILEQATNKPAGVIGKVSSGIKGITSTIHGSIANIAIVAEELSKIAPRWQNVGSSALKTLLRVAQDKLSSLTE
jgi:hypothetical protein